MIMENKTITKISVYSEYVIVKTVHIYMKRTITLTNTFSYKQFRNNCHNKKSNAKPKLKPTSAKKSTFKMKRNIQKNQKIPKIHKKIKKNKKKNINQITKVVKVI